MPDFVRKHTRAAIASGFRFLIHLFGEQKEQDPDNEDRCCWNDDPWVGFRGILWRIGNSKTATKENRCDHDPDPCRLPQARCLNRGAHDLLYFIGPIAQLPSPHTYGLIGVVDNRRDRWCVWDISARLALGRAHDSSPGCGTIPARIALTNVVCPQFVHMTGKTAGNEPKVGAGAIRGRVVSCVGTPTDHSLFPQ